MKLVGPLLKYTIVFAPTFWISLSGRNELCAEKWLEETFDLFFADLKLKLVRKMEVNSSNKYSILCIL